ncbi:ABC transporter ATP-binding protein [Pelotomaculum isophthalicicum JI]|uniref:ABC transporter ATP-binding protein n=1 Tax=Pelotomaculum isophthalicicum JI TaxID=947010 RepID=A0A9X4JV53_9FIRM|nr:ABC transporter ATP-binding protein [Pelotomaculum isophthalicicum]MDF9407691.1 ABC transporter ATP-binding protein [Pelotomaculum isophthalicicum JI]
MKGADNVLELAPALNKKPAKIKLAVKDINHMYLSSNGKPTECLKDINLEIEDHKFVAIVGPSGCGKSTLLNIMSGLIKPTTGDVFIEGKPINGIISRIGYMSQSDALLPWRTVIENVALGLEIRGITKAKRKVIAKELIQRAGLGGFEESYPFELSGGMRKRVAVIRILALDPEVLFMDEPFGPLDVFTREKLQDDILKLWQETKKTIVFVTHDLAEAITLADRVILMTSRPSTIKAIYDIPLKRPRSAVEIRFEPRFLDLHKLIWNDLRDEVIEPKGGLDIAR